MHIINEQQSDELEVMIVPINIDSDIADVENALQKLRSDDECGAGYEVDGSFQGCGAGSCCPNTAMVDYGIHDEFYCTKERYHQLRKCLGNIRCRQPLLDFYWSTKAKTNSQDFLIESGFVTSYE